MFKKKNIQKKADISKDLEQILIPNPNDKKLGDLKANQERKMNLQDKRHQQQKLEEPKRLMKYGLIEKQVKQVQEKPKLENFFLNLYIKRRMAQIQVKQKREANDTTASQILQMQKQYLSAAESKVTQYDVKQIQKKLQKMATDSIKTELQARNAYLINLLQNQHERAEYASKKEIKVMKQQKELMQRNILTKYSQFGKKSYIENIKQSNINDLS